MLKEGRRVGIGWDGGRKGGKRCSDEEKEKGMMLEGLRESGKDGETEGGMSSRLDEGIEGCWEREKKEGMEKMERKVRGREGRMGA